MTNPICSNPKCHREVEDPTRKRCAACREKGKKYDVRYRELQKVRKPEGVCSVAGCKNAPEEGNKKCNSCLAYMREYKKEWRAERKEEKDPSLCSKTDCNNLAEDGFQLCPHCREQAMEGQRRDPLWNDKHKAILARQKERVFGHYGTSCACCGVTEPTFLSIDHMDGRGSLDLTEGGYRRGGYELYRWLIEQGFPEGFRTLCFNCNFSLGHSGYCPHSDLTQETRTGRPPVNFGPGDNEKRATQRVRNQQAWLNLKIQVLSMYGGPKCVCCGDENLEYLTLDHVDGNGAEHRREASGHDGRGWGNIYIWLRRNGYPPGFQVLCMNCNWAKYNCGKCPHQP